MEQRRQIEKAWKGPGRVNWLNINTATLDSPEFLGADPVQRAAWLCLLRYCAGQENGGTIANCSEWKDRQWQQVVRVTLDEVMQQCELYQWSGSDLVVSFYPAEKETEIQERRARAAENGKKGGRPRKESVENSPVENPEKTQTKPTLVIYGKAEGERKEKEKENEKENKNPPEEMGLGFEAETESRKTAILTKAETAIATLFPRRSSRLRPFTPDEKRKLKRLALSEAEIIEDAARMAEAKAKGWEFYSRERGTLLNRWDSQSAMAGEFLQKLSAGPVQIRRPIRAANEEQITPTIF